MKRCNVLLASLLCSAMATATWSAEVPPVARLSSDQSFTYRVADEFASIDPQTIEGVVGFEIARDLFEGLYSKDENGDNVPGVAISHEISEDRLTYTFTLRDNAKWSDGNPVTAADFVYAWQRAVDPELASPYGWYINLMQIKNSVAIMDGEKPVNELGVSAPDDHTFVVNLEKPLSYFEIMVAHPTTFPTPKWAIDAHGEDWTKPENIVSNGAYILTEHDSETRSVRKPNPMYWNHEKTVIDEVVALVIVDEFEALKLWEAGELDKTESPAGEFERLSQKYGTEAYALPRICNYYLIFNLHNGPEAFQDVRVRQALSLALDREYLVEDILRNGGFPAYTFTPSTIAGFMFPDIGYASLTQDARDIKAKTLLAEAGYGKGKEKLTFDYLYNNSETHEQIANTAAKIWDEKLGVKINLVEQEWTDYFENRTSQQFQMARGAWCGDYNEPSTFLDILTSSSGYNDGKYHNQRVEDLMGEAKISDYAAPLYEEVEQILADDMPVIPILHFTTNLMLSDEIKGWPINNVEMFWYSKDFYRVAD